MFVVLLTYQVPLEQIDQAMRKHMAWLRKQYSENRFLVSGRRVPRTGGVLIAKEHDKDALPEFVESDPFVAGGLATYEIIEFNSSQSLNAEFAD